MSDGWDDLPETESQEDPLALALHSEQDGFFADDEVHKARVHWLGMPEFNMEDLQPKYSITVNFMSAEGVRAFEALIGQPIRFTEHTRGLWYPPLETGHYFDKRYIDPGDE